MIVSKNCVENTVKSSLELAAIGTGDVVLKVFDREGRIAKIIKQFIKDELSQVSLNIADLKKGSYVINIFQDNDFVKAVYYIKN